MPRPCNNSLNFTTLNTNFYRRPDLQYVKNRYDMTGVDVYLILRSMCYEFEQGYYLPYETEIDRENCLNEVRTAMLGKHTPSIEHIEKIIDCLFDAGLLEKAFKNRALTSKEIQQTYYTATTKRRGLVINPSLWLLSFDEMKVLDEWHPYFLSLFAAKMTDTEKAILHETFGDVVLDDGFRYSAAQYIEVKPLISQAILKDNFKNLSVINRKIKSIIAGKHYQSKVKAATDANASMSERSSSVDKPDTDPSDDDL